MAGYNTDGNTLNRYTTPAEATTSALGLMKLDHVFHIYPLPAGDQLHIELNEVQSGSFLVRISDLTGAVKLQRQVYHNGQRITTDISQLNNGIYYIELTNSNNQFKQKIVVSR